MRKIHIDCIQEIPCDPCQHCCPVGAITIGTKITDLPKTDKEKCTGCGICVASCPGQACFLVDEAVGERKATVDFPYEFLPKPQKGQKVMARNNQGEDLCEGVVEKVIDIERNNKTMIVRILVPVEYAYQVRGIKPVG